MHPQPEDVGASEPTSSKHQTPQPSAPVYEASILRHVAGSAAAPAGRAVRHGEQRKNGRPHRLRLRGKGQPVVLSWPRGVQDD